MKTIWLTSAGAFALMATPAFAQSGTAPSGQTGPLEQSAEVNTNKDVTPTDETNSNNIVITAQGRAQVLEDVPIAVSAVSAESLQNSGATDIRQLNQLAPSLLVSSTGTEANGSARIRGIGTVGDNPGLESSVAVFIDGVYRSRTGVGLNELGEIERVEVLRGPQGTLFGRNASAGLLNIISKKPNLNEFEGFAEASYGNYNMWRLSGALSGPIGKSGLGFRIDSVYQKRDGFYHVVNPVGVESRVNNRDRFFVRGQLLYEPSDQLKVRLIGDYTKRNESCCGAVYVDRSINSRIDGLNDPVNPILVGGAVNPAGNNIINVLRDLGEPMAAFSNPYSRNIYISPGRTYKGHTTDGGVSLQIDWKLGGNTTLTSISAWRDYRSGQPGDIDYSAVDILYRSPTNDGYSRHFRTLSQELRLQGTTFNNHLDWLIGGYYADENLNLTDNLRFGTQYGRFATCRIVSGGGLAALYSPTSPGCLAARPALFGAASPIIFAGFDRLDAVNDKGATLDRYFQNSRNYAFFTHNIFHITDKVAFTAGLRYTNERKRFHATFGQDNTACPAQQAALDPFLTNPALAAVAGGLLALTCQGNTTSELNGVTITDRRSEHKLTGTGVLSWKPVEDLMVYASYSRGYKAGGFNLDRSALKSPLLPFAATPGGAQALVGNLQFAPEINNAYEVGAKYSHGVVTANLAIFRQDFRNFQLNTFNGTVFLVQTINGCKTDLAGADRDLSATTGACPAGNVSWGVRSEGVELETAIRPSRDLDITAGFTYANTKYRSNLVGNSSGAPLDPALRVLPGKHLSNAPSLVGTASVTWTPRIGDSGLHGLFYVDARMTNDYNTGSDLFPQKRQDAYAVVNARLGIRGPQERWAIEVWAQNLFNQDYAQVAFNSPFQAGATSAPFVDPQFPGGRQIFSAFLAEPRTYGLTGRIRF
ncbi:MAG: iron complex outerrane recepter protein [Sphingomonadales bacterium]|jgi:outer membrane receptor protein involved in Fe transport|nr:iron complex outerrane recepter protein [Sphingomonadales bacterium]